MVRSLNGKGEKPAIANRVIQVIIPPSEPILFLQNKGATP